MKLREAYKMVIAHLLEHAEERGEESLVGLDHSEKELLAEQMANHESCTEKLVEAIEEYIEDFGGDIGLW